MVRVPEAVLPDDVADVAVEAEDEVVVEADDEDEVAVD
jgi:hypothetical protein